MADLLLPYLQERRSRQECMGYLGQYKKVQVSEKTVDEALKLLVDKKAVAKKTEGKESYYKAQVVTVGFVDDDGDAFQSHGLSL